MSGVCSPVVSRKLAPVEASVRAPASCVQFDVAGATVAVHSVLCPLCSSFVVYDRSSVPTVAGRELPGVTPAAICQRARVSLAVTGGF